MKASTIAALAIAACLALPCDGEEAKRFVATFCLDCHDSATKEGNVDLNLLVEQDALDGSLVFENLITGKMPPPDAEQPTDAQRRVVLDWLARRQQESPISKHRRISRHEFVHSVNDLLGIRLDLADSIPEDRGTHAFDSDRSIMLTSQMLAAYFAAADEMLDFAFPEVGFPQEQTWTTSKIKNDHETYNIYTRAYHEGILFSWTRANNGNSYSFFYDGFDPPEAGWYELTFDAAKVGDFVEDVSLQVHAGKYYYADDRPQPQRLVGVISLGNKEVKSHTIKAFLRPGENVSVHCYSKHTWRQKGGDQGAYIKQLRVRGPVFDQWPPRSIENVFAGLKIEAPQRKAIAANDPRTMLKRIGGRLSVSSFQKGMEKEKMQDGSHRTFWHSRFTPTLAKPPHFVILENPAGAEIKGLSYATWSGGNGNGQVKAYSVFVSDDGNNWPEVPITQGKLETRLANEQPIVFPKATKQRFIKFLVTDAVALDGKSLASIGKLDVMVDLPNTVDRLKVAIDSRSKDDLRLVIRRFAQQAFVSELTDDEMAPYFQVSLDALAEDGDFIEAAKVGMKAVICSPRFLYAPGNHNNASRATAANLARVLWLSIPDQRLIQRCEGDGLTERAVRQEVERMLRDDRSQRMVHSLFDQWLNLRTFNKVSPSLKLYPRYDDLLNHYLPLETEAYLHFLIQENLPVRYLIDSDFSLLNQRLAQHYGVDGVIGQQMRKVAFDPQSPRGGLLTMGSVLKVTTDGFGTSPILRGAWISQNIAGNTLSPPPENIKAIEPDASEAASLREQIKAHKNNASCYACHKSIDPYGFALESFDATGQWRSKYRVEKPHRGTFQYRREGYYALASAVDSSGEVDDTRFEDVHGLKKILLSQHRKVAYNFAKKIFEYANGHPPTLQQRLDLFEMTAEKADDCRMRDLIADILVYSFAGDDA